MNNTAGSLSTTASSPTIVTNCTLSITLTKTSNVFIVANGNFNNTNSTDQFFQIFRDSTAFGSEIKISSVAAAEVGFSVAAIDESVAAGSYTYSLKVYRTAGTLTVNPARISAIVI